VSGLSYGDSGVVTDGQNWFYQVSAVNGAGLEGPTGTPRVTAPPVLSGSMTPSSMELSWTDAEPVGEVAGYRVYYGPGTLDSVVDVGLTNSHSVGSLTVDVNYVAVVTALDDAGNESGFSNTYWGGVTDQQELTLDIADLAHMCWLGRGNCDPQEGQIQRDAGREILIPVDFPANDWTRVDLVVTFNGFATMGDCSWPNPTGDIYDRLFSVFMLENDDCLLAGSCFGRGKHLELMHGVTPFGTDDSTGPRVYTIDVTPFAPLLAGRRTIGINTTTWDGSGWWADIEFHFTSDPGQASPKLPAQGFQVVHNTSGSPVVDPEMVTIPASASDVKVRLWISGHGSASAVDCSNPADEFCPRTAQISVDGTPQWIDTPWRTDCNAGNCSTYNACGFPSCTYDRSAWCPGWITCHDNEPCDQDLDFGAWLLPGQTHEVQLEIPDHTPGSWWSFNLVVYWYE
jgi:hypothetical protein